MDPRATTTSRTDETASERAPEVAHRTCVDDWVHAGVDVAEPCEDSKENIGVLYTANMSAHCVEQIGDEEWDPAGTEHTHYNAQRLGRLSFSGDPTQPLPTDRERLPATRRRHRERTGTAAGRFVNC